jgi:hypothetical protein
MRHKKFLSIFLIAVIAATLFAGCASKEFRNENAGEAVAGPADGVYENGSVVSPTIPDRKLIRRVSMDIQTRNMEEFLCAIDEKVNQLEGYIESSNVKMGADSDANRHASLTIRIPVEKTEDFANHISSVSNVTATSESAEDITLNYVAIESRQKALQAEETRLLALIDKAANLSELLQLEKRLTEIRSELETVTSQLKLYDNLVDYSTIQLEISEVKEYTPTEKPGFWQRIGEGFANSLRNTGKILLELLIFLVCALPYLTPPIVILGIVLLIVKLTKRKRKQPPKSEE